MFSICKDRSITLNLIHSLSYKHALVVFSPQAQAGGVGMHHQTSKKRRQLYRGFFPKQSSDSRAQIFGEDTNKGQNPDDFYL